MPQNFDRQPYTEQEIQKTLTYFIRTNKKCLKTFKLLFIVLKSLMMCKLNIVLTFLLIMLITI